MDHTERIQTDTGIDWDQASLLYCDLIASCSEALQVRATVKLARLSKHAPESVLAGTISILVDLLYGSLGGPRPLVQEAAAYALYCIARRVDGSLCSFLGQLETIPILLRLLPLSSGRFRRTLLRLLRTIVAFDSTNRAVLARNGGLNIILDLLSSCNDNTKQYMLEILTALATLKVVRPAIINLGGLPFLIEAVTHGKMISRTRAAHAIGLLGVTRRVRHMVVDLGAIPSLVGLLRDGDAQDKLTAGNALGIISSHIDYLRPVAQAGAIPLYAEMLEGPEPLGKEIAEDVFCVLAVAQENALLISEHLVRILKGNNEEAKAAAADVLWDFSGYKHSVSVVRDSGAIPLLLELLQNGNVDVREKASGAIAQLSYEEADRRAMAEDGVIPILIDLLRGDSDELKDNAVEALINFSEDPYFRDCVSVAFDIPSFQAIRDRLVRLRNSDEHMVRSLRRMSVEQFISEPELT